MWYAQSVRTLKAYLLCSRSPRLPRRVKMGTRKLTSVEQKPGGHLLNKLDLRSWSRLKDVRSPLHHDPESDIDRKPTNSNDGILVANLPCASKARDGWPGVSWRLYLHARTAGPAVAARLKGGRVRALPVGLIKKVLVSRELKGGPVGCSAPVCN